MHQVRIVGFVSSPRVKHGLLGGCRPESPFAISFDSKYLSMPLGLASNTMTIEQLRLGASVIFIRAFEAIYKTIITEKIIRPMNKADHAANAELFLKALKDITQNSDLDGITGMEISDGDYNAIGVVVCIMFAEGQRLWADRIRRKKAE